LKNAGIKQVHYSDPAYLRDYDDFSGPKPGLGAKDDGACLVENDNRQVSPT